MKSSSQGRILYPLLNLRITFPAPQTEVTRLDGAKVSEQVKSHKRGKIQPLHQGVSDMPSGCLPSSQQTPKAQEQLVTPLT